MRSTFKVSQVSSSCTGEKDRISNLLLNNKNIIRSLIIINNHKGSVNHLLTDNAFQF